MKYIIFMLVWVLMLADNIANIFEIKKLRQANAVLSERNAVLLKHNAELAILRWKEMPIMDNSESSDEMRSRIDCNDPYHPLIWFYQNNDFDNEMFSNLIRGRQ